YRLLPPKASIFNDNPQVSPSNPRTTTAQPTTPQPDSQETRASPTCLALITSRDTLGGLVAHDGVRLLTLNVLTPEEATELLARIAGHDRVDREPQAAAEVARLCGYLPLAVRISAAKLATRHHWTLADIAERLADEQHRLYELKTGDVEIRASFALSYQSLELPTAQMFRHLGLIAGPDFTAGVVAALVDTNPKDAEALLETLVDVHLLEATPASGRYRFHDLLRLYARERLQAEERDQDRAAAMRRMLNWYLDAADAADRVLTPARCRLQRDSPSNSGRARVPTQGQARVLAWFEAERASLVAATRQAADCGLHKTVWQLADALWSFFYLRKHWADWHDTHHVGLVAAQAARDRQAEAWMLTSLGAAHEELRRFEEAVDCYERSLAICRKVGARRGEGRTLNKLGIVYRRLRRFEEAIDCYQRSLAIRREIGDRYGEGGTLNNLGDVYRDLQGVAKAIECYQRALMIHREVEDRRGEGVALANLGETYRCLGRFDEAIDHCHQALMIHREVGARHGEARTLDYLGLAVQHTEGIEAARACWRESLMIFDELGAPEADEVRARIAHHDCGA
ncbi:MAG: tetratricopeptide repeat protein, partial [Egibacteraceae bacterium]